MKKYKPDFLFGIILGLVIFFGGHIFLVASYGSGGLLGYDFILKELPIFSDLTLLGIPYAIFGIILFLVYVALPKYKKNHTEISFKVIISSLFSFLLGIYLAYFLFLLFVTISFSQWEWSL